jgi:hypothetical protein
MRVRLIAIGLVGMMAFAFASASAASAAPVLGAPMQVSSSGDAQDFASGARTPSLAYDPVSRRALIAWELFTPGLGLQQVVLARLLDAVGRPLGPQFVVSALSPGRLDAVAALPRGGFLIAGRATDAGGDGTTLRAVRVSAQGATGVARKISARVTSPSSWVGRSSVAFDRPARRGLIAWTVQGRTGRAGVFARAIDDRGRLVSPTRTLARRPHGSSTFVADVSVGLEPASHRWLAAWNEDVTFGPPGYANFRNVFARQVNAGATPRGPVRALAKAARFTQHLVGPPTAVTQLGPPLVLFTVDAAPRTVQLLRLRANGRVRDTTSTTVSVPPLTPAGSFDPVASAIAAEDRYLLVYSQACNALGHEQCVEFAPVMGQLLTTRGRRSGPAVELAPQGLGEHALGRTGKHRHLIAWTGGVASGVPYEGADAMVRIFPHKSEVFVRTVVP